MELISFFGRFHPVFLHLPIGFLVLGYLLLLLSKRPKYAGVKGAIGLTLGLGFLSAGIATLLGYWLSLEGGYDAKLLNQHKWLGIATTALSAIVYGVYQSKKAEKMVLPLYTLTVIGLLITGHLGGNITHGSDYLVENAPNGLRKLAGLPEKALPEAARSINLEEAEAFGTLIRPIIKQKCESCHNPGKVKGRLLMNTVAGLQKGGKSGDLFVAGDPEESLMHIRIHMDNAEKKHMPPKGKLQLDQDEKKLITWWIKEGADFTKKIAEYEPLSETIQGILDRKIPKENPVYAMDLAVPSERQLGKLKAAGVEALPIADESPFLAVSLVDKKDKPEVYLKKLKKVAANLVKLELSRSAITDELVQQIAKFPNLIHLRLDGTSVGDKGLKQLKKLKYLESLNLYQTSVSDAGLEALQEMPNLKKVYLWQSQVSPEGVAQLMSDLPGLYVSSGAEVDSLFNDVKLKPPVISAENNLFLDTLSVELKLNLQGVDIYYTLDGSDPDESSPSYEAPIPIKGSTTIKAIALKEGWQSSEVSERQFVRVAYQPENIQVNNPPSERYAANGAKSLIDLTKGTARFTDGTWLGWDGQGVTAILDLGAAKPVSGVTVSALESTGAWIFFPKGIRIYSSMDGQNFTKVAERKIPTSTEGNEGALEVFQQKFSETIEARFLKVEVESNRVNPPWHQGAGETCWIFLDEIVVE